MKPKVMCITVATFVILNLFFITKEYASEQTSEQETYAGIRFIPNPKYPLPLDQQKDHSRESSANKTDLSNKGKHARLPQTGEKKISVLIGLVIVMICLIIVVIRKILKIKQLIKRRDIMKKTVKIVLLSTILLGVTSMGIKGNATGLDDTSGHLTFEKGELNPVPVDPTDPSKPGKGNSVPTFDFGVFKIGEGIDGRIVLPEGEETKSKDLESTGVANFTGDNKAWMLSLSASAFNVDSKSAKDELTDITFDFSDLTATPVNGDPAISNQVDKPQVVTEKEASPIFISPSGGEAAGQFQFDYTQTKLDMPVKTAQQAKNAAYKSILTWNLSAVGDSKAQIAAVPVK